MKRLVISMSLFVGAAVPVLAPSTPAHACSQVACGPQIVLPTRPGYIWFPSNAVNFPTGSGYPGPTLPRIFNASGAVVAASGKKPVGGRATVFSPDADLPPGEYALEYDPRCLPWTDSPVSAPVPGPLPKPAVVQFRVGEPAAPPTTAGALMLIERGTAGEQGAANFVRLLMVPSAEMSPYMASATWTATVDGKPYGEGGRVHSIFPDFLTLDCVPGRAQVPINSCGWVNEVVAGTHRVVMKAVVAGLDVQPAPIEVTVDVCGGGPVVAVDGGAPQTTDASPTPPTNPDAVPPGPLQGAPAAAGSTDGCAVAPSAPTRGALLVALASLMALGVRRKRASRS